jgi:hypothetical protein
MPRQRFSGYSTEYEKYITLVLQGDWIDIDGEYQRLYFDMSGNVYLQMSDDVKKLGSILCFNPFILKIYEGYEYYRPEAERILFREDHLAFNMLMSYRRFKPSKTVMQRLRKKGIKIDFYSVEARMREKFNIPDDRLVD